MFGLSRFAGRVSSRVRENRTHGSAGEVNEREEMVNNENNK